MIRIQLSNDEKDALSKIRNQTSKKNSEKALIVLLSSEGLSPEQIAEKLKRHPHTIRDWLKRYQQSGITGLSRKYSPGRPSIRSEELIPLFDQWLVDSPHKYGYVQREWTVALIGEHYYRQTGKRVSEDTIQRALKDADFTYKRPKKSVPDSAPSREEKKKRVLELIQEIKEFIQNDTADIIALDESHFSSEPYIVKGWFKKKCSSSNKHTSQEGEYHDIWRVEYEQTKILLEKRIQRKHEASD